MDEAEEAEKEEEGAAGLRVPRPSGGGTNARPPHGEKAAAATVCWLDG